MMTIDSEMTADLARKEMFAIADLLDNRVLGYMQLGTVTCNSWPEMKDRLNALIPVVNCNNVIITKADGKLNFGIYVLPDAGCNAITEILLTDDDVYFQDYQVEIDERMFNGKYTGAEIMSLIIYEIHHMMNHRIQLQIRLAYDAAITNTGRAALGYIPDYNKIEEYQDIIRYTCISFLRNLGSVFTFEGRDDVGFIMANARLIRYFNLLEMDKVFTSAVNKFGNCTSITRGCQDYTPALNVFIWALDIIDADEFHAADIIDTLSTAKNITGSKLEIGMIERIIKAVKKKTGTGPHTKTVREIAMISEGFSLFKSLKTNGLRGIEDDLYEYKIRIKNCEEEEDAMYILRQINVRLGILRDYLENADEISDAERRRWERCIESYIMLRAEIGKKKLGNQKQYGIFIDYDKLDQMYG